MSGPPGVDPGRLGQNMDPVSRLLLAAFQGDMGKTALEKLNELNEGIKKIGTIGDTIVRMERHVPALTKAITDATAEMKKLNEKL